MTAAIQIPDQDLGKVQAFLAEQNVAYTVLQSPLLAPLQNADEHEFLRKQLSARYEEKINGYEGHIAVFEQKYGMAFEKFCETHLALESENLYENEWEAADWEGYIDLKKHFQQKLSLLNDERTV